ncbi:MAG: NAD(P)H-dependent flavin oxidoreductase [Candidatus Helarchaeota archaeon]
MIWRTKITEIIGCKYPILLGAFAGYDNSLLTAEISDAGAFGVLTASSFENTDKFRSALQYIKGRTTNPFGINFSAPTDIKPGHLFYDFLEIAYDEGINTIITAAAKIQQFGKRIKEYGMTWIHKVTTMKHAISGEKMGADAIIITGLEGGGLKNPKQNTFLINLVNAKRLLNLPIIASGGISTGKSILAALILGADAVHACTIFLAAKESPIPDQWKQEIIETDCFNPEFIKKVYHFESDKPKYTGMSMAIGTIQEIKPVKQIIMELVNEAENSLKAFCKERNR